jgi:hypothetical protein
MVWRCQRHRLTFQRPVDYPAAMARQRNLTYALTKQAQFADRAIDALGGTTAVANLFGVDTRVVSNWRVRGVPTTHYAVLAPMLAGLGWAVSPELFGQRVISQKQRVGHAASR